MGKYDAGLLGHFFGKVGTVIGSTWRGVKYMRHKGPSKRTNNSELQLDQQAKFRVAVTFVTQITRLIDITYKDVTGMTPRNSAVRNILKNAITGDYPTYNIDYSKVQISKGSLARASETSVSQTGSILTWRWKPDHVDDADPRDHSILFLYCPETGQSRYRINLAPRSAGSAGFDVSAFSGKMIYTYICFRSEKGDKISDSVYTGELMAI